MFAAELPQIADLSSPLARIHLPHLQNMTYGVPSCGPWMSRNLIDSRSRFVVSYATATISEFTLMDGKLASPSDSSLIALPVS
jgi:hypothetical protein